MPRPSLTWDVAPAGAKVVVLVMHGGAREGRQRNRAWSHNVIRLVPIARSLAKVAGPIAVARVRFGILGWNGTEASPLADGLWALEQARATYPGASIALVGHSMGGRVALYLGDEPDVRLVVGLSPWIEKGDPRPGPGVRTVLIHGDRDIICPLWASRRTVDELLATGQLAALIRVARSDHALLVRARLWHRLVAEVVEAAFADELAVSGGVGAGSSSCGGVAGAVRTAVREGGIVDL